MSNVTLSISGRSYVIACAEGEEAHVLRLGQTIDRKVAEMGDNGGLGEARKLLFAALLLADELHEARQQVAASQQNADLFGDSERLEIIASRLEKLASRLEG